MHLMVEPFSKALMTSTLIPLEAYQRFQTIFLFATDTLQTIESAESYGPRDAAVSKQPRSVEEDPLV